MGRKQTPIECQDSGIIMAVIAAKNKGMVSPFIIAKVGSQYFPINSKRDIICITATQNEEGKIFVISDAKYTSCPTCAEPTFVVSSGHPTRKLNGQNVEVHQFYCKKCNKHFVVFPEVVKPVINDF